MQMLNDRLDECVATLDRERMALELVFSMKETDGTEYLYWVSVQGGSGEPLDSSIPIDRDHLEQAKRTKKPGWTYATPELLLMPQPVEQAVLKWARFGAGG